MHFRGRGPPEGVKLLPCKELWNFEGRGFEGRWKSMAPVKVDEETCIATIASGGLGGRLKVAGKEFLIENQEWKGMDP